MRRKKFAKRITAIVLAATTMLSVAGTNTLTAQAADVNQDTQIEADNGADEQNPGPDAKTDSAAEDARDVEEEAVEETTPKDEDENQEGTTSVLPAAEANGDANSVIALDVLPANSRIITADEKKSVEDAIALLPKTWNATMGDGSKKNIDISWTCMDDFNNSEKTSFVFAGSFADTTLNTSLNAEDISKLLRYEIIFASEAEVDETLEVPQEKPTGRQSMTFNFSDNSLMVELAEEDDANTLTTQAYSARYLAAEPEQTSVLSEAATGTMSRISATEEEYAYLHLTDAEKELYNAIDQQVDNYLYYGVEPIHTSTLNADNEQIDLSITEAIVVPNGLSVDRAQQILMIYEGLNPQAFFLSTAIGYGTRPCTDGTTENILIGYLFPDFDTADEIKKGAEDLSTNLRNTVKAVENPATSDYEAAELLHNALCERVVYDHEAVKYSGPIPPSSWTVGNIMYDQSIASAFIDNSVVNATDISAQRTVCAGYAKSYTALARLEGFEAMSVTSRGHEWNKMKLYDTWFIVDCTWDDMDDASVPYVYDHFLVPQSYFDNDPLAKENHTEDSTWKGISPAAEQNFVYGIKFDANTEDKTLAGEMTSIAPQSQNSSVTLGANVYTRADYAFVGWDTLADRQNNADGTHYAAHTEIPVMYEDGEVLANGLTTVPANKELHLYAKWAEKKYTITYDGNGADNALKETADGQVRRTMDTETVSVNDDHPLAGNLYTRKGYTLSGWNTDQYGRGQEYAKDAILPSSTAKYGDEIVLYAQWSADQYDINYYNIEDGMENPNPAAYSVENLTDGKLILADPISNDARYFDGWYTTDGFKAGTKVTELTADTERVHGAVKLYAKWSKGLQIVFDANTPEGQTVNGKMPKATFQQAGDYTFPENNYSVNGYAFQGWAFTSEATSAEISDHQTVSLQSGTLTYSLKGEDKTKDLSALETSEIGDSTVLTLYAVWKKADLQLVFDANGSDAFPGYFLLGDGTLSDEDKTIHPSVLTQSVDYKDTYYVGKWSEGDGDTLLSYDSALVRRDGYEFTGWNTQPDGRGTTWYYGSRNTNNYATGSVITLYAQWRPVTYYISYNNTTSTRATATLKSTYKVNDSADGRYVLPELARNNYKFLGWYKSKEDAKNAVDLATGMTTLDELGLTEETKPAAVTEISPANYQGMLTPNGSRQYIYLYAAMQPYTYTVTYDLNAENDQTASLGIDNKTGKPYVSGQMYEIDKTYQFAVASRNGFRFDYWTVNADGSGNRYGAHTNFRNLKVAAGNPDFKVYAHWTPITYAIDYNLSGGRNSNLNPLRFTVQTKEADLRLYNATKTNYVFKGWSLRNPADATYTDADLIQVGEKDTLGYVRLDPTKISAYYGGLAKIPRERLIVYAVFEPYTYTIRYHSESAEAKFVNPDRDDASVCTVRGYEVDQNYQYLKDIYRPGYSIANWNTRPDGNGSRYTAGANFRNLTTTADDVIDLYAQWTQATYRITYDLQGGNNNGGNISSFNINSAESLLKNARLNGNDKLFDHWEYVDKDGKTQTITSINPKTLIDRVATYNITLTAVWKPYRIVYHANGGNGWALNEENPSDLSQEYTIDGDVADAAQTTDKSLARTGYILNYWSTNANGSGNRYNPGQTYKRFASTLNQNLWTLETVGEGEASKEVYTLNLYASWARNGYTISYQNMSGARNGDGNPASYHVESADVVLSDATKTGYKFAGWYSTADQADAAVDAYKKRQNSTEGRVTEINASNVEMLEDLTRASGTRRYINLYPAWVPVTYTLRYHSNFGNDQVKDVVYEYGINAKYADDATFTNTGYSLNRWNTRADGSGSNYYPNRDFRNMTDTDENVIDLYAQWNTIRYTITYDLRNGDSNGRNNTTYYVNSEAFSLNDGTRANASFLGWYRTSADARLAERIAKGMAGRDVTAEDINKKRICLFVPSEWAEGGNITLYAAWDTTDYTVEYNLNANDAAFGKLVEPSSENAEWTVKKEVAPKLTVAYGDNFRMTDHAVRLGYTLSGWNTRADGRGTTYRLNTNYKNLTSVDGTKITLYAVWSRNTYYINYNLRGGGSNRNISNYNAEMPADAVSMEGKNPTKRYADFIGFYASEDEAKVAETVAFEKGIEEAQKTAWAGFNLNDVMTRCGQAVRGRYSMTLYAAWLPYTYELTYDLNTDDLAGTASANGSATAVNVADELAANSHADLIQKTESGVLKESQRPLRISVGEQVVLPADSATTGINRPGYILTWNTRADGRGSNYRAGQTISNLSTNDGAKITLYANWTKINYSIRYHMNGGSNPSTNSSGRNVEQSSLMLSGATKNYANFLGWYASQDEADQAKARAFENKELVPPITELNADTLTKYAKLDRNQYVVDLYAAWKPFTYTVTYHSNATESVGWTGDEKDGEDGKITTLLVRTYEVGTNGYYEEAPKYPYPGYTQTNWNTRIDGKGSNYRVASQFSNLTVTDGEEIDLYAIWNRNNYSIHYNNNGGRLSASNVSSYNADSENFILNNPTRENYTFKGWAVTDSHWNYDAEHPTILNKINFEELKAKNRLGNLYLKAIFEAHTYDVTYKADNFVSANTNTASALVRNADGSEYNNQTFTYTCDQNEKTLSGLVRYGYTLAGWRDVETNRTYGINANVRNLRTYAVDAKDNDKGNDNDKVVTLEAIWRRDNYSLRYELYGGNNNGGNPGSYHAETKSASGAYQIILNAAKRNNYNFLGWYKDPDFKEALKKVDGSENWIFDVSDFVGKGATTIYAKWAPNRYVIHYTLGDDVDTLDANGKVSPNYSVMAEADRTQKCDVDITYRFSTLTNRAGYEVTAWKDLKTNRTYTPGAAFRNYSLKDGDEINLEAVWTPIRYNIRYELDRGSNSSLNATYYDVNKNTMKLRHPSKNNYEFIGWYSSKDEAEEASRIAVQNQIVERKKAMGASDEEAGQIKELPKESYLSELTLDKAIKLSVCTNNRYEMKLYAAWRPHVYSVTYHLNSSDGRFENETSSDRTLVIRKDAKSPEEDTVTKFYQVDETGKFIGDTVNTTQGNVYRSGYRLGRWTTKANNSGSAYAGDRNFSNLSYADGQAIHLYAQWSLATYRITYEYNGGRNLGNSGAYNVNSDKIVLKDSSKNYSKFIGWYSCDTTTVMEQLNKVDYAGNENRDAEKQKILDDVEKYKVTSIYGGELEAAGRDGSDQGLENGLKIGDIKLYALWDDNDYEVIFDLNEGDRRNKLEPDSTKTLMESYGAIDNGNGTYSLRIVTNKNYKMPAGLSVAGYNLSTWKNMADNRTYGPNSSFNNLLTEDGSSITLTAQWSQPRYSIRYNMNGGNNDRSNPTSYLADNSLTIKAPTRSNYKFEGWYLNTALTKPFNDTLNTEPETKADIHTDGNTLSKMYGNLNLYAKWSPMTYSVEYLDNKGQAFGTEVKTSYTNAIDSGRKADQTYYCRSDYGKAGYVLKGWTLAKGSTGINYYPGNTYRNLINSTSQDGRKVTLYAVWGRNNYSVTFVTNGGSINESFIRSYNAESEGFDLPSKVSRRNYTFAGWYTDPNFSKEVTVVPGAKNDYVPSSMAADGTLANLKFYAKWTANTYKVVFHNEDGSVIKSNEMNLPEFWNTDSSYKMPSLNKMPSLKRDGYAFKGWATDANSTRVAYSADRNYSNLIAGTDQYSDLSDAEKAKYTRNLYAVWSENQYSIRYNLDGGSNPGSNPTTFGITAGKDGKLTIAAPTRSNAVFTGWYVNGIKNENKLAANANYSQSDFDIKAICQKYGYKDVTLYAAWKVDSYKVKFDLQDSEKRKANIKWATNTAPIDVVDTESDKILTLHTGYAYRFPTAVREGYSFAGWSTVAGSGRVNYSANGNYRNVIAGSEDGKNSITLYAVWRANSYRIYYNYNGGRGQGRTSTYTPSYPSNYTMDNTAVEETGKDALIISAPTRTGYTFEGWYLDPGFKVLLAAYDQVESGSTEKGTKLDAKALESKLGNLANITIYAKWRANKYTVNYDANDGTLGRYSARVTEKYQYEYGNTYVTPADVNRAGYTFRGWNTDKTQADQGRTRFGVNATISNLMDQDQTSVVLYAVWGAENTYSVRYNYNGGSQQRSTGDYKPTYPENYKYSNQGEDKLYIYEPVRSGYSFEGWYLDNTFNTPLSSVVDQTDAPAGVTILDAKDLADKNLLGNLNLYAKWADSSVSYDMDAENLDVYKALKEIEEKSTAAAAKTTAAAKIEELDAGIQETYRADQNYVLSSGIKLNGYTLTSWQVWDQENDAEHRVLRSYNPGTSVRNIANGGNIILHAVWTPVTYRINYYTNGGSLRNQVTSYTVVGANNKATEAIVKIVAPNRIDYTFDGWYTTSQLQSGSEYKLDKFDPAMEAAMGTIGDKNLYAAWSRDTYTINYYDHSQDGSWKKPVLTQTAEMGTYARLNSTHSRLGYTLAGWNTEEDGSGIGYARGGNYNFNSFRDVEDSAVVRNGSTVNLYAQWKMDIYRIHWDANGGNNPKANTDIYNYNVDEYLLNGKVLADHVTNRSTVVLENPTRTNYTFAGWYCTNGILGTDADGKLLRNEEGNYYFETKKAAEIGNINLKAEWSRDSYTIEYHDIDRDGNDIVLNAVEQKNTSDRLKVGEVIDLTQKVNVGDSVRLNSSYKKPGYTLRGWTLTKGNKDLTGEGSYRSGSTYRDLTRMDGKVLKLYAIWDLNTYTIRYNLNGASYDHKEGVSYPDKYDIEDRSVTIPDPVDADYYFAGWYLDSRFEKPISDYVEASNADAIGMTVLDTDQLADANLMTNQNLYAKRTYNVSFDANEGSIEAKDAKLTDCVRGVTYRTNNTASRTGYTLRGWNSNKEEADLGRTQYGVNAGFNNLPDRFHEKDITLYAVWSPITYSIAFNSNGGTIQNVVSRYTMETATFALPDENDANKDNQNIYRNGYIFGGWYTSPDFGADEDERLLSATGSEKYLKQAVTNINPSEMVDYVDGTTLRLYAKWTPIEYTVNYYKDAKASSASYSEKVKYDENRMFYTGIMNPGYAINGWHTDKNEASLGRTKYGAGNTYRNLSAVDGDVINLYGVWTPKAYTIVYHYNGGSRVSGKTYPTSVNLSKGGVKIDAPYIRYNYFMGWYLNNPGTDKEECKLSKEGKVSTLDLETLRKVKLYNNDSIQLYAKYEGQKYNLTFDANGGAFKSVTDEATGLVTDNPNGEQWKNLSATDKYTLPGGDCVARPGAKFLGWDKNPNATSPKYKSGGTIADEIIEGVENPENITLYAIWSAYTYKVNYQWNGGSKNASKKYPDTFNVKSNEYIEIPAPQERTGWIFRGWRLNTHDDKLAMEEDKTTKIPVQDLIGQDELDDITLYAAWEEKTYNVAFDLNGGKYIDDSYNPTLNGPNSSVSPSASWTHLKYSNNYYLPKAEGLYFEKAETKVVDGATSVEKKYLVLTGWTLYDDKATVYKPGAEIKHKPIADGDVVDNDAVTDTYKAVWSETTELGVTLTKAQARGTDAASDPNNAEYIAEIQGYIPDQIAARGDLTAYQQNKNLYIDVEAAVFGRQESVDSKYYLVTTNQSTGKPEYYIPNKDLDQFSMDGNPQKIKFSIPLINYFSGVLYYRQCIAYRIDGSGNLTSERVYLRPAMDQFALATNVGTTETPKFNVVSNKKYVADSAALSYRRDYDGGDTVKGIQGGEHIIDASGHKVENDLGVSHVYLNLYMSQVVNPNAKDSPGLYEYNGKKYTFNSLGAYLSTIRVCNEHDISVTLQVMLDWNSMSQSIHHNARSYGHQLYSWENEQQAGRETVEAAFAYLGEKFGGLNTSEDWMELAETVPRANYARSDSHVNDGQCFVSNWILGNEINSKNVYQYSGGMSTQQFFDSYAQTFRTFYSGIKSVNGGAHVYICLDHCWNSADYGYSSRYSMDQTAMRLQEYDPTCEWDVAFHPYANPLTTTDFWNNSGVWQGSGTSYINMYNLNVLTDYIQANYPLRDEKGNDTGAERFVILSEQGYSSNNGYRLQASALAYSYYIASYNPMVKAFEIRSYQDDANDGILRLGIAGKEAYNAYKYVDDSSDTAKTYMKNMHYWTDVRGGAAGWQDLRIPGYDGSESAVNRYIYKDDMVYHNDVYEAKVP